MIQHVRFNIRNGRQNVSDFLKIGAKDSKTFNKVSEVKNTNFHFCTTFFETISNLKTHFYLVFWLLPYQWHFRIKAELWCLWQSRSGAGSCWESQAPSKLQQLLQIVLQPEVNSTVRMLCHFCMTWPRGVTVKWGPLPLHQLLICPDSVGAKNLLNAGLHYFILSDVTESWKCLGHHLPSHIPLQSKFSPRHLHSWDETCLTLATPLTQTLAPSELWG